MSILTAIRKYLYRLLYFVDLKLGNKPKIFVLCYHSISADWRYGVSVSEFKKQINYLKNFYNFITPKQFELYLQSKINLTFPSVLLTFDDGYEDVLKIKSFLEIKGIKPIMFLLSDPKMVDRQELATQKKLLSDNQINSLKLACWELGSHGANHYDYWTIKSDQIQKEIVESKKILTKKFGRIEYFAYPKGRFTPTILKRVSKAGYKLAFGMNDSFIDQKSNKFLIPRIGINQTHDFQEFKALFSPSVIQFRRVCKIIKLERIFI